MLGVHGARLSQKRPAVVHVNWKRRPPPSRVSAEIRHSRITPRAGQEPTMQRSITVRRRAKLAGAAVSGFAVIALSAGCGGGHGGGPAPLTGSALARHRMADATRMVR